MPLICVSGFIYAMRLQAQESNGEFPWKCPADTTPKLSVDGGRTVEESLAAPAPKQNQLEKQPFVDNPKVVQQLASLVSESQALQLPISFCLPRKSLVAGQVLQHALSVTESLFAEHQPMIFKIGWTHNPIWRWANPLYGYVHDVDPWSNMVVLHISHEAWGPAMLEASLINQYQSH